MGAEICTRPPLQRAQLERGCSLTAHIGTSRRGPRATSQRTPTPSFPYQRSALSVLSWWDNPNLPHPSQANIRASAAAPPPGRAYLQETFLQQAGPQAPPLLQRASPAPLLLDTKPPAEAPPLPKYQSPHPPDEPQMRGSLARTSKLLQRGPEHHPALAALRKEGDVGLSGGIWCIYQVPQTWSHLGQPPAGRTVANLQLAVQRWGQSWVSEKALRKMKMQGCNKEWGDDFNPSSSLPPVWSHLNRDLGVT